MSEENNTETYLCISENKFEIYLFDKIKLENIFSNEILIDTNSLDNLSLDNFLDENIIKIEKCFFFTVAPCFECNNESITIPEGATGIYRYRNSDDEVIYIGRGNIRDRLRSPERKDWDIAKVEYSLINDRCEMAKMSTLQLSIASTISWLHIVAPSIPIWSIHTDTPAPRNLSTRSRIRNRSSEA